MSRTVTSLDDGLSPTATLSETPARSGGRARRFAPATSALCRRRS